MNSIAESDRQSSSRFRPGRPGVNGGVHADMLEPQQRFLGSILARRFVVFALLVFSPVPTVRGDAVFTSDGSKIVGRIERFGGGKLVIVTEIAGKLEIDADMITAFAVDEPLTVAFESGDRLVGTIEVSADQSTSVFHSALGDLTVTPSEIAAIWPVGGESPEVVALKAEAEQTRIALTPKWTTTLQAGGSRTEGNTDTLQVHGRLDVKRKTKDELLHFFLTAKYYEQNDNRTTNEYRGGVMFENALTDKWYWYTRTELEFDEFEALDLRATAAAGAGYYWLKKEEHELKTRLGLGYRHEAYDTGRIEDQAIIDLGLDYRFELAPWVQFTQSTTYSPDFQEFNNYRLDADTALVFPFKDPRVKLKVGMSHEYNSRPQSGFERLDTTYYANVILELKRPED
ncbi:MAG: DUF481 domain-containing protein [Planctomycetes bacterium]|nr:DUF481 domain-containing protein [Planctomycetota bacterium]